MNAAADEPEAGRLTAGAERRTAGGPRPVAATLDRLIARAARRRGFGEARILTEWTSIAGAEVAAHTRPERIRRARDGLPVLVLVVESGWGPEIQHLEPVLLDRIARFLGHRAIGRLSLRQVQALPVRRPPRVTPRPPSPELAREIEARVADVADAELRDALRDLAMAVLGRP